MNNRFSIKVVFYILLGARLVTTSEFQSNEQTADPEVNSLSPRRRVLKQAASDGDYSPPAPTRITKCSDAILGAEVNLEEGRVLKTLNTSTIGLCCEACQEMESCTSWSRNRSSGACELINATQASFFRFPPSDFDVGGFLGWVIFASFDLDSGPRPSVECSLNRGITLILMGMF